MSDDMFTTAGGEVVRERRIVGVGNYAVATEGETLVAYGLGACVAVGLYDEENGVGALAHTVLPSKPTGSSAAPGKFADETVRVMLKDMVDAGAAYGSLEGWLVGGADVFPLGDLDLPRGVGKETATVARKQLAGLDIPIVAEATGGDTGRTVEFDAETGKAQVRHTGEDEATVLGGANA